MPSTAQAGLEPLRARIRDRSPLPAPETERILAKHFTSVLPIIRYLQARYGFGERRVLEIGSSYGEHLFHWGEGSEGIEARSDAAAFTTAVGFRTHDVNVEDDLLQLGEGSFQAIHTNNLIEHLVAPHLFLARCYRLLTDDGLLVLGHPVVPPAVLARLWTAAGVTGWDAVEHINFFTPSTARRMLERSGFSVAEQLSPGFLRLGPAAARLAVPVGVGCYSVCRKQPGYMYDPKRRAEFDPW